jgi:hypothetical protein
MKKYTVTKLNILLAAGIICILAGIFLTIWYASTTPNRFSYISAAVILAGGLFVYIALAFSHKTLVLYIGLVMTAIGILRFIVGSGSVSCTMKQLWPVIVIFCGIALFPAGFFRYHRIRASYLFPALVLVFLGGFFLLFSLDIITISFTRFVSMWWPLLLVALGGILVGVFLYQQHCNNQFPYIRDDAPDGDPNE